VCVYIGAHLCLCILVHTCVCVYWCTPVFVYIGAHLCLWILVHTCVCVCTPEVVQAPEKATAIICNLQVRAIACVCICLRWLKLLRGKWALAAKLMHFEKMEQIYAHTLAHTRATCSVRQNRMCVIIIWRTFCAKLTVCISYIYRTTVYIYGSREP